MTELGGHTVTSCQGRPGAPGGTSVARAAAAAAAGRRFKQCPAYLPRTRDTGGQGPGGARPGGGFKFQHLKSRRSVLGTNWLPIMMMASMINITSCR